MYVVGIFVHGGCDTVWFFPKSFDIGHTSTVPLEVDKLKLFWAEKTAR
jgi:hypothetical protein